MLTVWPEQVVTAAAINEGRICRFLTKPCPIPILAAALSDGLEQYRLVQTERHLLGRLAESNLGLRTAQRVAEEATAAKSAFLAMTCHEIRGPLTALLGYAELLLDQSLDESERSSAIAVLWRNGRHLLDVVNNMLDLSKIEAGRLDIESLPVSPVDVLEEVAALLRVRADARGLALVVSAERPLPATISSDRTRLKQILINLVSNAIQWTRAGGVTLTATLHPHDTSSLIEFAVRDTGVGLSPQAQARLFQPFAQADGPAAVRASGTGLGLHLSQRFAQLMGGRIEIESRVDHGSTFRVFLPTGSLNNVPLVTRDAASAAAQARGASAGLVPNGDIIPLHGRILLAEDSPDIQRLIAAILQRSGAEVVMVGDGAAAVESAMTAREIGKPFDIILMDMHMPVLDGYSAVRSLRHRGYRGAIIALSAYALTSDRDKCLAAGCDDYLSKPIQRQHLLKRLSDVIAESRRLSAETSEAVE
jgi:signal transduction histidine kinase/CheY-like chemotaxis protein